MKNPNTTTGISSFFRTHDIDIHIRCFVLIKQNYRYHLRHNNRVCACLLKRGKISRRRQHCVVAIGDKVLLIVCASRDVDGFRKQLWLLENFRKLKIPSGNDLSARSCIWNENSLSRLCCWPLVGSRFDFVYLLAILYAVEQGFCQTIYTLGVRTSSLNA